MKENLGHCFGQLLLVLLKEILGHHLGHRMFVLMKEDGGHRFGRLMFRNLLCFKHRCLQIGDTIAVIGEKIGKFEVVADGERGGHSHQRNKDDAEKLHFAWVCYFNISCGTTLEGDLGLALWPSPDHPITQSSILSQQPARTVYISPHTI
jgi:hypothetical protein